MPSSKNPNSLISGAGKIPAGTITASAQLFPPSAGGSEIDILTSNNLWSGTNTFNAAVTTNSTLTTNGANTFEGNDIHNGDDTFNGSNTFEGNDIHNGDDTFNGVNTFNGANTFEGNDIHNGDDTFTGSITLTGSMTLDRADVDEPRMRSTLVAANYLQIYEYVVDSGPPTQYVRMYISTVSSGLVQRGIVTTFNARWDQGTTTFNADNDTVSAYMYRFSEDGFYEVWRQSTTGVGWSDTAWENQNMYLGGGLVSLQAGAPGPANLEVSARGIVGGDLTLASGYGPPHGDMIFRSGSVEVFRILGTNGRILVPDNQDLYFTHESNDDGGDGNHFIFVTQTGLNAPNGRAGTVQIHAGLGGSAGSQGSGGLRIYDDSGTTLKAELSRENLESTLSDDAYPPALWLSADSRETPRSHLDTEAVYANGMFIQTIEDSSGHLNLVTRRQDDETIIGIG